MAKAMAIFGMIVAALLAIAFGLDLVVGQPFGGRNSLIDIAFAVSGLILGYMSYDAFRTSG